MLRLSLLLVTQLGILASSAHSDESTHELIGDEPTAGKETRIRLDAVDAATDRPVPVRVRVTDAEGKHVDGSGRGLYGDGRFFADGSFTVEVTPGTVKFEISHGPNYLPLDFSMEIKPQRALHVQARLHRWFSPAKRGWYAGDNHVHAQHDRNASVRTDLRYAALQARAGGLNFVTEAGSNVSYDEIDQLDTPEFLLRYAPELRPGPYVGHLNTPGIGSPIPPQVYQALISRPLPAQAIFEAVRRRGGIVTHTHPMTPVFQLHWMGAAEAYADAVLGKCADLFDVDSRHTEQLWFALLNLGNRIGVSSYTDSALGRTNTLSPGDRRLYCRAERFDYAAIVEAMRQGRTMATNGGPLFVFLSVDGNQPGDVVSLKKDSVQAHLEVHSLNALREVELYRNGKRVAAFKVQGQKGALELSREIALPRDRPSWLVARAQDQAGKWCLTSPIYFQPRQAGKELPVTEPASAILLEINNTIRFVQLRPQFFAHLLVTLRPGDPPVQIEWLRNGETLRAFRPSDGDHIDRGRLPVTGIEGEYSEGWVWYPSGETPLHFQADLPVERSGWYSVRVTTRRGTTVVSDQMYYDGTNPASHALSIANLRGPSTRLALWGYGEEVLIAALKPPYDQGEWWYPKNTYWRLKTQFDDQEKTLGWPTEQPVERFRAVE